MIGSCSSFDGTLNSTSIVRIDGMFNGEINSEEAVIIGEGGYVKGNIKSNKVTIAGKIEGNVFCSNSLELTSSGKLLGDVQVKTLNIEDGAVFQGKCTMVQQAQVSDFIIEKESDNLPVPSDQE